MVLQSFLVDQGDCSRRLNYQTVRRNDHSSSLLLLLLLLCVFHRARASGAGRAPIAVPQPHGHTILLRVLLEAKAMTVHRPKATSDGNLKEARRSLTSEGMWA